MEFQEKMLLRFTDHLELEKKRQIKMSNDRDNREATLTNIRKFSILLAHLLHLLLTKLFLEGKSILLTDNFFVPSFWSFDAVFGLYQPEIVKFMIKMLQCPC